MVRRRFVHMACALVCIRVSHDYDIRTSRVFREITAKCLTDTSESLPNIFSFSFNDSKFKDMVSVFHCVYYCKFVMTQVTHNKFIYNIQNTYFQSLQK